MQKKMIVIISVIVLLFAALAFVIYYKNSSKLSSEDNPYGDKDLQQSTIDQIGNPLYSEIVLPEDLTELLEKEESIMVYFFSPECVHCQKTTPVLMPAAEGLEVKVHQYNLLEFPKGVDDYGITATPTLVYFENGEEMDRLVGSYPEGDYKTFMKTYMK